MGPCLPRADQTARENWLDQSQDALIGIWRDSLERGTHVFEGGQCHRVDARKREPWGQNLLKLGASLLPITYLV